MVAHNPDTGIYQNESLFRRKTTHGACKAFLMPLPSHGFNSFHTISNAFSTFRTFGHTKPYMTHFAISIALVNGKTDIIIIRPRRPKERIAAFCTEKMLFVISAFPQRGIIKRDELLIYNRRLAVEALRSEFLVFFRGEETAYNRKQTCLMII
jgi:hypothetical protein